MPDVGKDVSSVLDLYAKCRNNGVLPYAGGLLDQPAWLMDLFGVIDDIKERHRREREREEAAKNELETRNHAGPGR